MIIVNSFLHVIVQLGECIVFLKKTHLTYLTSNFFLKFYSAAFEKSGFLNLFYIQVRNI